MGETFPADQAKVLNLPVERVDIGVDVLNVWLRLDGMPVPKTMSLQMPLRFSKRSARKGCSVPKVGA